MYMPKEKISKNKSMTFKEWVIDLFEDERGRTSIKPLIAFIGTLFLCGSMLANSLMEGSFNPSDALINAVMIITSIGMGADSVDKFSRMNPKRGQRDDDQDYVKRPYHEDDQEGVVP